MIESKTSNVSWKWLFEKTVLGQVSQCIPYHVFNSLSDYRKRILYSKALRSLVVHRTEMPCRLNKPHEDRQQYPCFVSAPNLPV